MYRLYHAGLDENGRPEWGVEHTPLSTQELKSLLTSDVERSIVTQRGEDELLLALEAHLAVSDAIAGVLESSDELVYRVEARVRRQMALSLRRVVACYLSSSALTWSSISSSSLPSWQELP